MPFGGGLLITHLSSAVNYGWCNSHLCNISQDVNVLENIYQCLHHAWSKLEFYGKLKKKKFKCRFSRETMKMHKETFYFVDSFLFKTLSFYSNVMHVYLCWGLIRFFHAPNRISSQLWASVNKTNAHFVWKGHYCKRLAAEFIILIPQGCTGWIFIPLWNWFVKPKPSSPYHYWNILHFIWLRCHIPAPAAITGHKTT